MRSIWLFRNLVRADFLERTRRYSFLVTLGAMGLVGYLAVPAADSGVLTVNLGQLRGVYNSAWIGGMIALLSSMLLSIPGFYLVKNAISRDRATGVGQIVATTPVRKVPFLFSKAVSNFVFLLLIVGLVMLAAAGMQLLRGEVMRLLVWDLVAPFLFITLPVMAVVAAVAILFECIPLLRGGFGNIVYFVLYMVVLVVSLNEISFSKLGTIDKPVNDLFGASVVGASMLQAAHAAYPDRQLDLGIGYAKVAGPIDTFRWMGVMWDGPVIVQRALWVGIALMIVLVASLFFDRFDPARKKQTGDRGGRTPRFLTKVVSSRLPRVRVFDLTRLPLPTFGRVLIAEQQLTLRGQPWWWYIVAVGLVVGGALTAETDALMSLLLAAWLWPVLVWSKLGVREKQNHTDPVVFSMPRPLRRQLPAAWLSGVLVAVFLGSGAGLHFALTGSWSRLGAWCVGAVFVPTLALAAGVWSGTPKLFEALYVVVWYIGPVSGLAQLDFMGVTSQALALGMPTVYLVVTIVLLAVILLGRARQIRS